MKENYKKSAVQREKERLRRRKLRDCVLNHSETSQLNQTLLARELGCSQSTVSRDLKPPNTSDYTLKSASGEAQKEKRHQKTLKMNLH